MSTHKPPRAVGRAAQTSPPNRFLATQLVRDDEHLEHDVDRAADRRVVSTEFLPDRTRTIISENDSPDVGFRYSINPYRGCEHGCAYCYARPTHELLGLNAGLDFETKILVKHQAAELLRAELGKPSWRGELIALSGVTDCYQPVERRLRLTRSLLEVMLEARQCVGIVTKNALVLRDLDLLTQLAQLRLAHVNVSVTTLDADLARAMEPRTSPPAARLDAIRQLAAAGVPVRAMLAPIVPGLNDHEIPSLLEAAAKAGAKAANYILLRLPLAVRPVFMAWLEENRPLKKELIESRIRSTREGEMNSSQFRVRMRGRGHYAEQIGRTFRVFAKKHGLDQPLPELDTRQFRPPRPASGQQMLF
jgi:DNA repair photolyase